MKLKRTNKRIKNIKEEKEKWTINKVMNINSNSKTRKIKQTSKKRVVLLNNIKSLLKKPHSKALFELKYS